MRFSIFSAFSLAFFPGTCFAAELGALRGVKNEGDNKKDETKNRDLIVGGKEAEPDEFPYFVGLGGCGGSLVDSKHVLTAAHCEGILTNGRTVNIGQYNKRVAHEGTTRTIDHAIYHPQWDPETLEYDAALVVLDHPVLDVAPVTLADTEPNIGEKLTIVGHGTKSYGGSASDVLQKADYECLSCGYSYGPRIGPSMFCAGNVEGVGGCQGDAGVPVVLTEQPTVQVGISSWGTECGVALYPDVHISVAEILGWINEHINTDEAVVPKPGVPELGVPEP